MNKGTNLAYVRLTLSPASVSSSLLADWLMFAAQMSTQGTERARTALARSTMSSSMGRHLHPGGWIMLRSALIVFFPCSDTELWRTHAAISPGQNDACYPQTPNIKGGGINQVRISPAARWLQARLNHAFLTFAAE
jgi:hypothetical protein